MPPSSSKTIRFDQQSNSWFAGMPIGNGRTGAMITGGVPTQTVSLNDETFWSPGPRERDFAHARDAMEEVRRGLAAGDVLAAQAAAAPLLGSPSLGAALQPIGNLTLTTGLDATAATMSRSLDLATGLVNFRWDWGDGRTLSRDFVASRDPSVFVVRQRSTIAAPVRVSFGSPFDTTPVAEASDAVLFTGRWHEVAPNRALVADSYRLRDYAEGVHLRFAVGAIVLDGDFDKTNLGLVSADWTVAIALGTDFAEIDPIDWVRETLAMTKNRTDDLLLGAIATHAEVFARASIDLGWAERCAHLTTDQRVHAVRAGALDDHLFLLVADYGRYLQIASTLGGDLPPTLQGIWNADTEPAWSSNYTLNINLQMNLWSADAFQFPEAFDVLRRMVERLAVAGRRTADELYGAEGWVVHHNSDLWLNTAPTTLVEVGLFAGAGLWLVQELFRHWQRYPSAALEESLFELLLGSTQFLETWLTVDSDGYLVTSPSSSPENGYLLGDTPRPRSRAEDPEFWRHGWIGEASVLEMLLVRDTLWAALDLGGRHGADPALLERWTEMLVRLRPVPIVDGELPEWTTPHRALELGHRHLSPLYGVYPGQDDFDSDPLRDAARITLENRLANVTSSSNGWGGWSRVWAAACWARLGDGDRALASLSSLLATGIAPQSLLHAFPDFDGQPKGDSVHQSDANLGFPAAIVELLVQSRPGSIRLLPALPTGWHSGSVSSIRVVGGIDVSFSWTESRVASVRLLAERAQAVSLMTPQSEPLEVMLRAGTPIEVDLVTSTQTQEEASQ